MTIVTPHRPDQPNYDAEALIEEARQRQKGRHLVVAAVVVMLAAGLAAALAFDGGGSHPSNLTQRGGGAPASAQGSNSPSSVLFGGAFLTGQFQPIAGESLWATTNGRLYLSSNGGQRWTNITPPHLTDIAAFTSLSDNELWFATTSGTNGSAITVDRSTNGGRAWTSGHLPSCGGSSCEVSLSFVTLTKGWALVATAYSSAHGELFSTTDGGTSWDHVSATSFGNKLDFSTTSTGWATGVGSGKSTLFRTVNSGKSWDSVSLPPIDGKTASWLGQPQFFSEQSGLVPAVLSNGEFAVLSTRDAGRTWSASLDPNVTTSPTGAWINPPHFWAASPTVWAASVSTSLSMTDDAGRSWSKVRTPPVYANNPPIFGFAMANASSGWLDAYSEACTPGSATRPCGDPPLLLRTTNGGRSWRPLPEPTR